MCKVNGIISHWFTISEKTLAKYNKTTIYSFRTILMFRHSQFFYTYLLSIKRFQKLCLQPWNEWRSVAIKIPFPLMSNFNYWISDRPLWNIVKIGNRSIGFRHFAVVIATYEHRVQGKISLREHDMFAAFLSHDCDNQSDEIWSHVETPRIVL